jgi:hypothetical protein
MSDKSKYENEVCPFCELPIANDEQEAEYERRLKAADDNDNDPDLCAWAANVCWYGWAQPGECRNGMSLEGRLIEVLEKRDTWQARVAELEAGYATIAHILRVTEASTIAIVRVGEVVNRMVAK